MSCWNYQPLCSLVLLLAAFPGHALGDTAILRGECRKGSDRGCSVDVRSCYEAPQGFYIVDGSLSQGSVDGYWNRNPICGPAEVTAFSRYLIPQTVVVAELAKAFCASLHVESGSGFADIGRVAYINCSYSFDLGLIPQQ